MRRVWIVILVACLLVPLGSPVGAAELEVAGKSALLMDAATGKVLYEKNAHEPLPPASVTKVMTMLLIMEAIDSGKIRWEDMVTASETAAAKGGSQIYLKVGETMSVSDMVKSIAVSSANDCACAMAEHLSGSEGAFVEAMNAEAQRLGTLHTRYTNPTGLHDPAMCTTARDVAIIAREAYGNDLYMLVSSAPTYTVPATNVSEERLFTNRNSLISDSSQNYYNGYCAGMNAGMTDEGGWCVVTVCERNGASNLCIILRGLDVGAGELIPAYVQTNRLLAWANRSYGYRTVLSAGDKLDRQKVNMTGISKSKADIVPAEDLKIYLPTNLDVEGQLEYDLILSGDGLTAPLKAGDLVGTVTVSYQGRIVGKAPLTVTEDFAESGFLRFLQGFKSYLLSRAFWLTLPILALLLLPYLYVTGSSRGRYGLRTVRRRKKIRYTKRHL